MKGAPTTFDFMGKRKQFMVLSCLLMLVAVAALLLRGIPLGLDFSGGVLVELGFPVSPNLEQIRQLLADAGLGKPVVQYFGTDTELIIRLAASQSNSDAGQLVYSAIAGAFPNIELLRSEYVGAQVGDELLEQGGLGVLVALIAMLVYVALRFQLKFAIGAVLALVHDVLLVLLVLSIFHIDFDLAVLAAVMTVVGYSLNDSLVISDHVRADIKIHQRDDVVASINRALNQVLWRTINTSVTTLLVTLTLMLVGGESVFSFALALSVGVFVGTYSSIFILCSVLCWLGLRRTDLVVLDPENQNKTIV